VHTTQHFPAVGKDIVGSPCAICNNLVTWKQFLNSLTSYTSKLRRGIRAVCCAGLVYLNLNKCARRSKNALPPKKKCGEQPNKYLHNHAVQISQPSEATDCSKQVLSYSWQNWVVSTTHEISVQSNIELENGPNVHHKFVLSIPRESLIVLYNCTTIKNFVFNSIRQRTGAFSLIARINSPTKTSCSLQRFQFLNALFDVGIGSNVRIFK